MGLKIFIILVGYGPIIRGLVFRLLAYPVFECLALILWLIYAISSLDADQIGTTESTYDGAGFRVERIGLPVVWISAGNSTG